MPARVIAAGQLRLALSFVSLEQGGSGLLRLSGPDISAASYTFRDEEQAFFAHDDGAWYALIAVEMDAPPNQHELIVRVQEIQASSQFALPLRIEQAGFIRQEFDLPADRARLLSASVEAAELAQLDQLMAVPSPAPLWDASGFELPLDSPLSSPYGSFRLLNQTRQTRHTGWDQLAPTGTPIHAMASGEVVFAGRLEIRGNTILIDHGLGIYSGYAHLSDMLVAPGQSVRAGQIIGGSGNSGRSSGPHLHWELAVQGKWLDGRAFLDLWLPA